PFQRRVCAYIRSRERAKFARLIHDNVLQTVEGLAVSPAVDSVGRGLLVREGTRLRELVDAYRTDRLVGAA
ncbi:MAG: hypothetical protein HOV83_15955, partial [Catenulispora sp.]|nr:hypothetical protein [Catenulispora sp.]